MRFETWPHGRVKIFVAMMVILRLVWMVIVGRSCRAGSKLVDYVHENDSKKDAASKTVCCVGLCEWLVIARRVVIMRIVFERVNLRWLFRSPSDKGPCP